MPTSSPSSAADSLRSFCSNSMHGEASISSFFSRQLTINSTHPGNFFNWNCTPSLLCGQHFFYLRWPAEWSLSFYSNYTYCSQRLDLPAWKPSLPEGWASLTRLIKRECNWRIFASWEILIPLVHTFSQYQCQYQTKSEWAIWQDLYMLADSQWQDVDVITWENITNSFGVKLFSYKLIVNCHTP